MLLEVPLQEEAPGLGLGRSGRESGSGNWGGGASDGAVVKTGRWAGPSRGAAVKTGR